MMRIIFLFYFMTVSWIISAQQPISFGSKQLEHLYNKLNNPIKSVLDQCSIQAAADTSFSSLINGKPVQLHLGFSPDKQLQHLGLLVYGFNDKDPSVTVVAEFVERILLEYLLNEKKDAFFKKRKDENVLIQIKGLASIKQLEDMLFFEKPPPFNLLIEQNSLFVHLPLNLANTLEISIPNDIGLLMGMNKDELELQLLTMLQQLPPANVIPLISENISPSTYTNTCYRLTGKYLDNDSLINQHTYYTKDDSGFTPLDDLQHPKETLSNIFQGQLNSNQLLYLKPMLYNNNVQSLQLKASDFAAFFKEEYDIYCGWQNGNADTLSGSLFMQHKLFLHKHLLDFKYIINENRQQTNNLTGNLYLYIPNENL